MKNETLKMEVLTVKEFFDKGRSLYIPDYQRAYSWGENQLDQWITDLEEIAESGQQYYLGRILLEGPDKNGCFAVVDGQQRLTTILLFLWTARKNKIDLSTFDCDLDNWIKLFQVQESDQDFFCRQMESDRFLRKYETHSQQKLLFAIKYFEKLDNELYSIIKTLLHAQLPTIIVKHKKDATLMFQLENDRGVKLTEMEKLKACLMYEAMLSAGEDHAKILNTISDIFEEIGKICFTIREKPDSVLKAHYRAKLTKAQNPYRDYSLELIKEHCKKENIAQNILDFCDDLLISFEAIQKLEKLKYEKYTNYFRFFRLPEYVLPILLIAYRKNIKDENSVNKLLGISGRLILRQASVATNYSRQTNIMIRDRLGKILEEFRQNNDIDSSLKNLVNEIEKGFNTWKVGYLPRKESNLWNVEKFNEWLESGYYPDDISKFLLFMYESHKKKKLDKLIEANEDWTLEHISPQSKDDRKNDGYAANDEERNKLEAEGYIPYIGNLCLLKRNRNSEASRKPFKKKRKIYDSSESLLHVQEISKFATEHKTLWGTEAIDARGEKLIKFITKKFSE